MIQVTSKSQSKDYQIHMIILQTNTEKTKTINYDIIFYINWLWIYKTNLWIVKVLLLTTFELKMMNYLNPTT